MTLIVGLETPEGTWIGGDSCSAAMDTYEIRTRKYPKVFNPVNNKDYIFGFTSSFRFGDLLQYQFKPSSWDPHDYDTLFEFLVCSFVENLRECLDKGGVNKRESNVDEGGSFLIAHHGELWGIDSDFHISNYLDNYNAIGCGEPYALGSLHTSRKIKDPEKRVRMALEASAKFSAYVTPPWTILFQKKP